MFFIFRLWKDDFPLYTAHISCVLLASHNQGLGERRQRLDFPGAWEEASGSEEFDHPQEPGIFGRSVQAGGTLDDFLMENSSWLEQVALQMAPGQVGKLGTGNGGKRSCLRLLCSKERSGKPLDAIERWADLLQILVEAVAGDVRTGHSRAPSKVLQAHLGYLGALLQDARLARCWRCQ